MPSPINYLVALALTAAAFSAGAASAATIDDVKARAAEA